MFSLVFGVYHEEIPFAEMKSLLYEYDCFEGAV